MIRSLLVRCLVVAAIVAGCNTILDNRPGTLDPKKTTGGATAQPPDDDRLDGAAGALTCAPSEHECHGRCVAESDPTYGCGAPSCEPCTVRHGTAACEASRCTVHGCDQGYADCNQDPTDGCEVDLSKATSCGSCNTTCPAATPVCAPAGASFQCATGCPADAPLRCGNDCVSPVTSASHCGGCDAKCAEVEHADVACAASKCTFTCKASYHACGGKCVVDTDPTACGPNCTECPVPTNAVALCKGNACTFECKAGFGDCNDKASDGCESSFATDPSNCGVCGKSCDSGTCKAGECVPAADAEP